MVNTKWSTCGRKLLLNDKSFFVRGVNYAPTPVGRPGRLDMLGDEAIFTRDLKNLRNMHANAVKTYDFYSDVDHTPFLDAAYNNGVNPIYTIFSIWIDQTLMQPVVDIDGPEFQQMVTNYYKMAKQTGSHPGVMGYSIGGEMNSIVVVNDKAFWDKFALLTAAVRKGLAENNHAQKIITTTFVDDGGMSFTRGEQFKADVDLWGSNVYQTNYPGSVIPAYKSVPGSKPLLVSEYGFPYASNVAEGTTEELHVIGDYLVQQAIQMEQNYNLTDTLKEQVLVGGFVFEYSDEWWKSGADSIHNYGGVMNNGFPMGWLAEEFFGLYRVEKSEHKGAVDLVYARPTVDLLTKLWSNGKLGGEGVDYSDCRSLSMTTSLQQLRHTTAAPQSSSVLGSVFQVLFAVVALCALALLAFTVRNTKSRRARYRRLSQTSELKDHASGGVSSYQTPLSPRRFRAAPVDDEVEHEV